MRLSAEKNLELRWLGERYDFIIPTNWVYDTHPHNLMEIILYCYEDQLAHRDYMGNSTRQLTIPILMIRIQSQRKEWETDGSLWFIEIRILPNEISLSPN